MWSPDFKPGYQARKCRYRVAALLRGQGLDLSNEHEKIVPNAIGIGKHGSTTADICLDLTGNDALGIFSNNHFDYVFDAHNLGNFLTTAAVLKEWWRVIRPGGYLILYEQDKDYYPHVGTPGADENRRTDLHWDDAWDVLESFGNAEKISASRHNESNEYSWQLVVRKTFALTSKPLEIIEPRNDEGQVCFPRKKKTDKEVLVIRYGALGDSVWATPVLSQLKKDGYYVVMNCTEYGAQVLRENPNVDEYIILSETKSIPSQELGEYWETIGRDFEKVINLTQSVEGSLLVCEGSEEYGWPHDKRHSECNINYIDRAMELAGYPEIKGARTELYFSDIEEHLAQNYLKHHEDKFKVLWALSGSGFHKTYPWAEYVAMEIAKRYPDDVEIVTVGDADCKILEWQNPRTVNKAGVWTVRQSFIVAKYVDLVIGPETGVMNAAACFNTPKIVLMSHSSQENLTKYWENCVALRPEDCPCHPCHKLIYSHTCPKGTMGTVAARCMEHIKPEVVLKAVEKYYFKWKADRAIRLNRKKIAAFTIADNDLTAHLAERVRHSFLKFHPDIPFFIYRCEDEKRILGEVRDSACACKAFEIRPRFCSELLKDYDAVIYLDADTVVVDVLNEFLELNYDVAGSLNVAKDEDSTYLNAGVSAITSRRFCDEWTELMYRPQSGPSNQVYFNNLAHSGRYKLKIVDEEDVYYNERSREYWDKLRLCSDGKLRTHGRVVKVLHWAGGVDRMSNKLSSKDFNAEIRDHLNKLTNTTDFTDIEGQQVSRWDK